MNLLHIKYAAEVAEVGSLNKAAEKLLIGQPNLSRAIKELETSLDIKIFERTAKGMYLTADGKIFMDYAKNILKQVDSIEKLFIKDKKIKNRFSVSVPHARYISDAFIKFTELQEENSEFEFFYKETDTIHTVKNILSNNYNLGIIRYAEAQERYYRSMLNEKGLKSEIIAKFCMELIVNKESELVSKENIYFSDLSKFIEISYDDTPASFLPAPELRKDEYPYTVSKRIEISERESKYSLISNNRNAFMWSSPVCPEYIGKFGLVSVKCQENKRVYRDVLIYKNDYVLTDSDILFIEKLKQKASYFFLENINQ